MMTLLMTTGAGAQVSGVAATDGLALGVEMQGSFSNDRTPLWLNANKHGISSLNARNGYVRAMGAYDKKLFGDRLDLNAGVDVIAPLGYKSQGYEQHYTNHMVLQQAFVEARYGVGVLTVGAKHQPMELKDNELSSGSQCLGINARPVPQVRIGLKNYLDVPFTKRWVAVKAHMAYGIMTDGGWEETFTAGSHKKYNSSTRYHQKAGYLRIGKEEVLPLTFTIGLEMATQFGGTRYVWNSKQGAYDKIIPSCNLASYWHAFTGTGAEDTEKGTVYQNAEGNHLGSWVMRLEWKGKDVEAGIYLDHYFEDHSSMLFLDYDGYGSGAAWNDKVKSRYFRYDLKDGLVGADVKLKKFRYVNRAVVEYMNTRYQAGPIYHDHSQGMSDHISGRDGYYGHSQMSGWQHYGQVMGNPLYLSPVYNTDGTIGPQCNRFKAWHVGLAGDPAEGLHYRAMFSWQKGWGTYTNPYYNPKENVSMLIEAAYRFPQSSLLNGFTATVGYGADWGAMRGNNSGVQMTVLYELTKKDKR